MLIIGSRYNPARQPTRLTRLGHAKTGRGGGPHPTGLYTYPSLEYTQKYKKDKKGPLSGCRLVKIIPGVSFERKNDLNPLSKLALAKPI